MLFALAFVASGANKPQYTPKGLPGPRETEAVAII